MTDATTNGLPQAGEAVALPQANPQEVAAAALFGVREDLSFYSFDPKTPDGQRLLDKCEESDDGKLIERANLKFRLAHIYAHYVPVEVKSSGEVRELLRICLVTTDGEVYSCVSEGVRKSIRRLMLGHGLPPWKGGIPVVVSLKKLSSDRQWLTILNDPDATPSPKKGGAK